jgi:hypothetical protein
MAHAVGPGLRLFFIRASSACSPAVPSFCPHLFAYFPFRVFRVFRGKKSLRFSALSAVRFFLRFLRLFTAKQFVSIGVNSCLASPRLQLFLPETH